MLIDFAQLVSFHLDSSIKVNCFMSQAFFSHRIHDSIEELFIELGLLRNYSQLVFVAFAKS